MNRQILIGILLCPLYLFACSYLNVQIMHRYGIKQADATMMIVSRLMQWALLLMVIAYSLKIEKQKLLLWKNQRISFPEKIVHVFLLWISVILMAIPIRLIINYIGLQEISSKLSNIKSILKIYPLLIPFIALTAGVVEEYIFRGYMQPRLERLTKSPIAAIFINALLFGAIHFGYGTLINMVVPFVIGILFSVYYWKFRNIYVLIACHTVIDLISLTTMLYSSRV